MVKTKTMAAMTCVLIAVPEPTMMVSTSRTNGGGGMYPIPSTSATHSAPFSQAPLPR
ncbi:Uncharacterised protein [Mycobacteroides abscessus subsp. abscessus]|nr:Uncharacterised protein [Mycobacteroides abscessus subsp. abscessus]